jgi:rubrerythrin
MLGHVTGTKTPIPVEDLYTFAKRNLELGKDAGESYSKLSQLVANRRAKDILIRLSALEKEHHAEAQLLVDTLEKMCSPILKE